MTNMQSHQSGIEMQRPAADPEKSNLSETAKLVNGVLTDYIMPAMREAGLVEKANEIAKNGLKSDDPQVVEFSIACREKQTEIYDEGQKNGLNEKEMAVIGNYFSKLINGITNSGTES